MLRSGLSLLRMVLAWRDVSKKNFGVLCHVRENHRQVKRRLCRVLERAGVDVLISVHSLIHSCIHSLNRQFIFEDLDGILTVNSLTV